MSTPIARFVRRILAVLVALAPAVASGCGALQVYEGPVRASDDVALLRTVQHRTLLIFSLSAVEFVSVDGEELGLFHSTAEVLPGPHVALVRRGGGSGVKHSAELAFEAKAGHVYEIDAEDLSYSPPVVAFWMVDAKDQSVVAGTPPPEAAKKDQEIKAAAAIREASPPPAPPPLEGAEENWLGIRRDGADGSVAPMTLRVRTALGGKGRIEEIEVADGEKIYRGLSIDSFDDVAGIWVREYVNSTRGTFVRLEGTKDGGRANWRSVVPDGGRESLLELAWPAPGQWRRTQSVSEDGGRTWRVLFTDELHRVDRP